MKFESDIFSIPKKYKFDDDFFTDCICDAINIYHIYKVNFHLKYFCTENLIFRQKNISGPSMYFYHTYKNEYFV